MSCRHTHLSLYRIYIYIYILTTTIGSLVFNVLLLRGCSTSTAAAAVDKPRIRTWRDPGTGTALEKSNTDSPADDVWLNDLNLVAAHVFIEVGILLLVNLIWRIIPTRLINGVIEDRMLLLLLLFCFCCYLGGLVDAGSVCFPSRCVKSYRWWSVWQMRICWIVELLSIGLTRCWIVELFVTEARSMQEARFKMIQDWKNWFLVNEHYYLFSSFISPKIQKGSSFISPKIQKGAKKNPKCRIPASHQTITTSTCARYCTLKTQCVKVCQKIRLSSITTKCLFTNNAVNRLSRYFSISTQPTIQYTVTG